jgi:hypothetical protein
MPCAYFCCKLSPILKKIIGILALLAVVVAALVWFYSTVEEQGNAHSEILHAIPHDAALVLQSKNATDIWRDLSQSSMIWEELQATDLYFRLNAIGQGLDSAMRNSPDMRKYLDGRSLAISVHSSGARSFSFLMALPLGVEGEADDVSRELVKLLRAGDVKQRSYDGVTLHSVQPSFSNSPITFFIHKDLLVMSLSPILAEESVRALQENAHILSDPAFSQLRGTTDANTRAQCYVHHGRLAGLVRPYVSDAMAKSAFFQSPFATWTALDLTMKANAWMLNGFSQAADSSNLWLSSFADSKATPMQVLAYMPSNTSYFSFYGFGDYKAWYARIRVLREKRGQQYKVDNALKQYNEQCNCDAERLASAWIGSQAAAFISEPSDADYSGNQYALIQTRDKDLSDESLTQLEQAFANEGAAAEAGEYEGYVIYKLQIGTLYGLLLGDVFGSLNNPYAVRVDDMVLMANSLNGLRLAMQMIEMKKSLATDEGFQEMARQLSDESHFAVYSSLSRSPFLYQNLLNEEEAAKLAGRTDVLRKFQGWVYQMRHHKNDLYYNNIYFKHNPVYEQETASLWEIKLKAAIAQPVHFVKNHYSNALEVLAQDVENRIYLVSTSGKVLWEVSADGPIMGQVAQIDALKNRKLQMVFNTAKTLYALDRNGNALDGFPIALPAKASAAVAVVDYDNSRDYRLFVPLVDGRLLAWDAQGRVVEGWAFADKEAAIVQEIEHIRVRSKDYLFAANAKGKIHLLDRRGNERHKVDLTLPAGAMLPYKVEHPEQVIGSGAVYVLDSAGVAYRIGFDDRMEKLDFGLKSPRSVIFTDLDGDGRQDYIVQVKGGAIAFDLEGNKLMDLMQEELASPLSLAAVEGNKILIAARGSTESKIYLFNGNGTLLEGFPLIGNVSARVGDMNGDGNFNLVTGMEEGYLYGYAIPQGW